jgi:hypothetical protein
MKGVWGMSGYDACWLAQEIGMDAQARDRFEALDAKGDRAQCLRMLMLRRAELLDALHEAQRPIDMVDAAIRDLKTQTRTNKGQR